MAVRAVFPNTAFLIAKEKLAWDGLNIRSHWFLAVLSFVLKSAAVAKLAMALLEVSAYFVAFLAYVHRLPDHLLHFRKQRLQLLLLLLCKPVELLQ